MIRLGLATGFLAGGGLVALGLVGSVVIAPPAERAELRMPQPAALPAEERRVPAAADDVTPRPQPETKTESTIDTGADTGPEAADIASVTDMPEDLTQDLAAPEQPERAGTTTDATDVSTDAVENAPRAAPPTMPPNLPEAQNPAALSDATPPTIPGPVLRSAPGGLPGSPQPPRDQPLPQSPAAPGTDSAPERAPTDAPRLPGTRSAGLPGQAAAPAPTEQPDIQPTTPLTALERNSSFTGMQSGAPMMAVILNDPGLPTPLRRALAALELPITVALNPMDPSASAAADIYRAAGKEVLILSNGLPAGARATDLDVTFSAWFEALPQAAGVLDLPRGGFARNTTLSADVLPLIARDGHGLVSFAGGLSQIDSAAQRAGVPHAQVFRVLDDEDQSPFTIRRYLDRAVFQASQIGEVLVFGDATNDATLEALEMWRSDGRADQVAVVPVSAILLTR